MTTGRMVQHPVNKERSAAIMNQIKLARRGPPISYRFVIGLLGFIFCLLPFCLSFFSIADLDVCMVERFPNRMNGPAINPSVNSAINQVNHTINLVNQSIEQSASVKLQDTLVDTSDFLADMIADPLDTMNQPINQSQSQTNKKFRPRSQSTSVMAILLITCCLIKACLPVPHRSTNNQINHHHTINQSMPLIHAFKVLLAYLWYLAAYFLCNALKGYIGDETCNVHANSISGHYLFHFYAGLALFHIHAQQTGSISVSICSMQFWRRLLRTNQAKFFMFFFLCYCLSSCIILMNTYLHGYHSMRQILYGIAMAMFAHWMMMDVLDMIDELLIAHIEKTHGKPHSPTASQLNNRSLSHSAQLRQRTLAVDDGSATSSQTPHVTTAPFTQRQFTNFSPFQRFLYWAFARTLRISEERGVFFIFPFIFVLIFQLVAFTALLLSPASKMWKAVDLIVLVLSWCLLVFIYVKYLKLPMGNLHSPSRQAHKQPAQVASMSLHTDSQA